MSTFLKRLSWFSAFLCHRSLDSLIHFDACKQNLCEGVSRAGLCINLPTHIASSLLVIPCGVTAVHFESEVLCSPWPHPSSLCISLWIPSSDSPGFIFKLFASPGPSYPTGSHHLPSVLQYFYLPTFLSSNCFYFTCLCPIPSCLCDYIV